MRKGITCLTDNQRSAGLNKSWLDAAFGQFFEVLEYIAEKAHRPRRGFLGVRTEQEDLASKLATVLKMFVGLEPLVKILSLDYSMWEFHFY